jgi:TPR repeat protein
MSSQPSDRTRARMLGLLLAATIATPTLAGDTRPVAEDANAAWTRFFDGANAESVHPAYNVISALGYDGADVDAGACVSHAPELRAAIETVPVSIALHRMALLCAEATGDEAGADAATDALEALSQRALGQAGEPELSVPIQVVRAEDAYAFLLGIGLQPRYGFFREIAPVRHFPLEIIAEGEDGRERRFTFDFVDVNHRIDRSGPQAAFPQARLELANAWIDSLVAMGHVAAKDRQALVAARALDTPGQKIEALRDAAAGGGVQAARAWIITCLRAPDLACEGLVDALLRAAEAGVSLATVHLAVVHAEGLGMERDQAMADNLLAAARRRMRPGDAEVEYIVLRSASPDADVAVLAAALRPLAAAGVPAAMVGLMDMDAEGAHWPAGMLARLESAPLSGYAPVARRLAQHHRQAGDETAAGTWRDRAVALGDPASQADRALEIQTPDVPPERQPPEVAALMREAAHGGEIVGARWMAWLAAREGRFADAELWLLPAINAGSADAIVDLADLGLFSAGDARATMRVKPDVLIGALRELAADGVASARLLLVNLALEAGHADVPREEGEALLREDAAAGDSDAMQILGSAYLRGRLGPRDVAAGREWLERAIEADGNGARGTYGMSLYYSGTTAAERAEGIEWLEKAEVAGEEMAANNLAWALCTSRHADVLDPARGARVAEALAARLAAPDAGVLDTFAACHAAVGEHARAVAMQEQAIAALPRRVDGEPDDRNGFAERLALYRAGGVYVELEDK